AAHDLPVTEGRCPAGVAWPHTPSPVPGLPLALGWDVRYQFQRDFSAYCLWGGSLSGWAAAMPAITPTRSADRFDLLIPNQSRPMMKPENEVHLITAPRPTVEVLLPDGRILCGPRNRPIAAFLKCLPEWNSHDPIMGAVVNGELRELTHPVDLDSRVRLIRMSDSDGSVIYRRSITFLLETAFADIFPAADISIDHSLSSGSFYCSVINRGLLSREELATVEARMKELVKADLPFERQVVPLQDAISYFQSKGQDEKVQLLKFRSKDTLGLYKLRDRCDYHHGYMVPSTGYLRWFALAPMSGGFALRFPRRRAPNELPPLGDSKKLLATFREYNNWLVRLGIKSVGALNTAIQAKRASEVILVSEALHEHRIAEIARLIIERSREARIVLVAGPSSSGKTTFSRRLTVQLLAQGISPFPLELDNYFADRERTPRDEKGNYDFECLEALDTVRLQSRMGVAYTVYPGYKIADIGKTISSGFLQEPMPINKLVFLGILVFPYPAFFYLLIPA
ncbi:MAG: hypothetical protein NT167_26480, partial [Verrucomicrobia bacterium]|nr:hypothetical protein [Verrucomicrobiota bacterium]